jgi:hypothetical protein
MPRKGGGYRAERLLEALARLWTSFRGRRPLVAVTTEHAERVRGWDAARGRFWTEFRAGQREAEAHSSRSQ